MELLDSITDARSAIAKFLISEGSTLGEATRDHVLAATVKPSPVDAIVTTMEALYADAVSLSDAGRTLVAQLAGFATQQGWHGLEQDNRGLRIMQAMQRELNEAAPTPQGWPEAATDPAIDPRFVATVAGAQPDAAPGPRLT